MTVRLIFQHLALIWMAVIFYLSHQSSLPTPELLPGQDKLFHALAYGVLGSLLLMSCRLGKDSYTKIQMNRSILIASLYGISDEIHQYFVPGREADVMDWVADTLGALMAVLAIAFVVKKRVGPSI
jgi:VanZ family protein